MDRVKKDTVSLNIKIDRAISDRLVEYCKVMGQTKTTAIERILDDYLTKYKTKQK